MSYTSADRPWAEWIAWELEEAGYSTRIQAWDMQPGSNFVVEMDIATQVAGRTIAVLSPAFLESAYGRAEWAAPHDRDRLGGRPFGSGSAPGPVPAGEVVPPDHNPANTGP